MKSFKQVILTVILVFCSAFIAVWAFNKYFYKPQVISLSEKPATQYTYMPSAPQGEVLDLTYAAEATVHAVVHVKVSATYTPRESGNPFFDFFYGDRPRQQQQEPQVRRGAGSGVILSSDGYIVTNHHVIEGADEVIVALNDKREFKGKVIGKDETTDIALLKIDAKDLPFLKFGKSDQLKLGEWVLAVGNPFNLTSTVTAGIVSAKSRNIGINTADRSIESFIQTDAAVNPGNSGGALVNLSGELVGINAAIASRTGTYSGYSFAVPSSIVEKVYADLKEFGQVQRALLGVEIGDVTAELAKEKNIDKIEGVYIGKVNPNSGAEDAGIKSGDIVLSVDDVAVNSTGQLQEQISKHRPGDKVDLLVKRDGKTQHFTVTLRNIIGNTEIVKPEDDIFLGAKFQSITESERNRLRINGGIKIVELNDGKLKDAGLKTGFIITKANDQRIESVTDLKAVVDNAEGGVMIEAITTNRERAYFAFRAGR